MPCCRELTQWLRDEGRLRTPGLFVQSADAALHPGASGGAGNRGISSHLMSHGGGQAIRKIRHALDQGLSVSPSLFYCALCRNHLPRCSESEPDPLVHIC